jgi:hypothetical protein
MAGSGNAQSQPTEPTEFDKVRNEISSGFKEWAALISAARRPLPDQTGDGTYLEPDLSDPDLLQTLKGDLKDFSSLGITDLATLLEVLEKNKSGATWDDSKYLMEKLIQVSHQLTELLTSGMLTFSRRRPNSQITLNWARL